ncbi:MAG: hypothetical protein NZ742_11375, partial [Acidobacteria bacterium]|nr:hypothetical protein [Acidobacteriota bacterium]MDW7985284.1 hypothetical protein [Acidobacteriota bacterium]
KKHGFRAWVGWIGIFLLGTSIVVPACRKASQEYQESQLQALRTLGAAERLAIQAELQKLRVAILQYMAETGQPPPGDIEVLMRALVPRYLPQPVTETHGMPIQCFVEGNRFELRVTGPDGQFHTNDDIVVAGP